MRKQNQIKYTKDCCIVYSRHGDEILVDAEDAERASKFYWRVANRGTKTKKYKYVVASTKKAERKYLQCINRGQIEIQMANFILNTTSNQYKVVDHINFNRLDNRKSNLRIVSKSENSKHTEGRTAHSKYIGVSKLSNPYDKNKPWVAQAGRKVSGKSKQYYFGVYKTQKEAAIAYDKNAIKLFGSDVNLNFREACGIIK